MPTLFDPSAKPPPDLGTKPQNPELTKLRDWTPIRNAALTLNPDNPAFQVRSCPVCGALTALPDHATNCHAPDGKPIRPVKLVAPGVSDYIKLPSGVAALDHGVKPRPIEHDPAPADSVPPHLYDLRRKVFCLRCP